jgi:MFS family permease
MQSQPPPANRDRKPAISKGSALKFVVLLGIVSLCADMTYEGARSITGPYLAVLGASASVVGIVSGLGELIGYSLRLASGYMSDRTQKYWAITLFGYALNLLVVPFLALAGQWEIAAFLMITERIGKGIRTPARDVILSSATKQVGRGWGFGLHEALDQIGAVLGPLLVAAALYFKGGYRTGFALLLVPAILALAILIAARLLYPHPQRFEGTSSSALDQTQGFPRVYWLYLAAMALVAAGFADFPLIAYHFQKAFVVPSDWIPIFYAIAMGVDALAALTLGHLFDRQGIFAVVVAVLFSALFAPLVFLGKSYLALLGMALWGIGMGAQESIMRAVIAEIVPANRRGVAYGIFNTGYGVFWFLGSALIGVLYDTSITALIIFSIGTQLASIPLLLKVSQEFRHQS